MKIARMFRKGPPPHIGWWYTQRHDGVKAWRWWDGSRWSVVVYHDREQTRLNNLVRSKSPFDMTQIEWCKYWPENARVERIVP